MRQRAVIKLNQNNQPQGSFSLPSRPFPVQAKSGLDPSPEQDPDEIQKHAPKSAQTGASFSQVRIFPERPESRNSGVPLPQCMRSMMEAAFHADFSDIRVHQGAPDAKSLSALAFTQGRDIHFAPGQYSPDSLEGQKIIGHELAHVVQQQEGRVAVPQGQGAPINDDAALEAEADALGAKAAQGEVVRPAGSNPRGAFHPVAPVQRMKLDEEKKPGENGQGAYTRQDGETTEEFRSRMAIEMAGLRQSMAENDEIYPEDRDQDRPDWAEEFTDPKDWHSGKYFGDPNKLLGTSEEWEKPPEQEAPEVDKDKLAQHIGKRSEETQALQENWNINGEGRSQGRVQPHRLCLCPANKGRRRHQGRQTQPFC